MHAKTLTAVLIGVALSAAAAQSPPITTSAPAGSASTVIGVAGSAGDEPLLQRVVDLLASDAELRGAFVTVTVKGNAVQLTGTANTPMQAAHAEEVARAAAGAAQVVNEIRAGG